MAAFFLVAKLGARGEDDPELVRLADSLPEELKKAKAENIPVEFVDFCALPGTDKGSGKAKLDLVFQGLGITARQIFTDPHAARVVATVHASEKPSLDALLTVADAPYFGAPVPGHGMEVPNVGMTGGDAQNLAIALGHLGLLRLQRDDPADALRYFEAGGKLTRSLVADGFLTSYWNAWTARYHIDDLVLKGAYGYSTDPALIDRLIEIHTRTFPESQPDRYMAGVFAEGFLEWKNEHAKKLEKIPFGDKSPIDGVESGTARSARFFDANRAVAVKTLRQIVAAARANGDKYAAAKEVDRVIGEALAKSGPFDGATRHILESFHIFHLVAINDFLLRSQVLCLWIAKDFYRTGRAPNGLGDYGDSAIDPSTGKPYVYVKLGDGYMVGMSEIDRGALVPWGEPYYISSDGRYGEWGLMYRRVSLDKDAIVK